MSDTKPDRVVTKRFLEKVLSQFADVMRTQQAEIAALKALGYPNDGVFSGLGHGSGAHAPDEYMLIHPAPSTGAAGLARLEKAYVDLLFAVAGR